jgi:hypothetical protein
MAKLFEVPAEQSICCILSRLPYGLELPPARMQRVW